MAPQVRAEDMSRSSRLTPDHESLSSRAWSRAWARVAALIVLALVAASCGDAAPAATGGRVSILAAWDGRELEAFRAMLEPFETATGITVDYSGSRDLEGYLDRTLAVGDAPDVVGLAGPSHLARITKAGSLHPLDAVVDLGTYKAENAPAFVDLGTVDDHLMGVFIKATVKGLLWYNPSVYRLGAPETWSDLVVAAQGAAQGGTRPWCLGLDSGATSGWPGTDWIEDFLIRQSGADAYDQWIAGKLAWTSDEVRRAFVAYGTVSADGSVFGGVRGALRTYFGDAGEPLFTDPAGCIFLHQGSFMSSFFAENHEDVGTYDFIPFPEVGAEYAGSVIGAGDLVGMVHDTPAARALIRYLVSEGAQQRFVDQGGALSGNTKVGRYPDSVTAKAAQVLINAKKFRFDASDAMPGAMNAAFLQAVMDYTREPGQLEAILSHLDAVQRSAYGSKGGGS
jgi:alpha-glucoside transport system substrate-binding protein